MIIDELTVGMVQTCCYILGREGGQECIVIDPGAEAARIRKHIGDRKIAAILLTHGHFDHIGAVRELMDPGTKLVIHGLDAPMLGDPRLNASAGLIGRNVTAPEATTRRGAYAMRSKASFSPEIRCLSTAGAGRTCRAETRGR